MLLLFFKAFTISWFIWQSVFDQFQILLTWFFKGFSWERCEQNNLTRAVTIHRCYNGYHTFKKIREEAGTNFLLLSCSTNVIRRFMIHVYHNLVTHVTSDYLTCCFCSYYSFMLLFTKMFLLPLWNLKN